jgi:deoxycytidylate deaminase
MNPVNLAIKQAKKANFKQRVGAVISKGNNILGLGYNQTNRYQSKVKSTHYPGSMHAEIAAIVDVMRRNSPSVLKGSTITIVRLFKDDTPGLAYPCEDCYPVIKNSGIKKIRFSNNDGTFSTISLY